MVFTFVTRHAGVVILPCIVQWSCFDLFISMEMVLLTEFRQDRRVPCLMESNGQSSSQEEKGKKAEAWFVDKTETKKAATCGFFIKKKG